MQKPIDMPHKHATLLGASGLVGNEVLKALLEAPEIEMVTVLVRKSLNIQHPKLAQQLVDFSSLDESAVPRADLLFCCIGSTRKKTPDKTAFYSVDFGITLKVSTIAKNKGYTQLHLISSIGAKATSKNFYLNLKGNIEKAIIDLSFDTTVIYRPSLLLGKRQEKRPMEKLGRILAPLFDAFTFGGPYHSVHAKVLASKMLQRTILPAQGVSFAYYPDF
jgi:uncharacterized protein YbjT (DUF2867 family)